MLRKRTLLAPGHPAAEGKTVQLNVRLNPHLLNTLNAGAAHLGLSTSNYVRWVIEFATKQVLEGPSKADQLKAFEEQFTRALPPVKVQLPPPPVPRDPNKPEPVIVHAPFDFKPRGAPDEGLDSPALQRVQGLLEQPLMPPSALPSPPALPPLQQPITAATEAKQEAKPMLSLEDLIKACGASPKTSGPQALGLPDDMDDWA